MQPDHPVIKLCTEKSNNFFIDWELESRKENNQPPYSNYTSLIFSSKKEKLVIEFSKRIYKKINETFKNIETFGVAEDGFFMVKAKSNPRFPIFMTNPMRIKTVEVYTNNEKPLTKLGEEKSDDDFLMDLLRRQHDSTSKTKKD